MELTTGLVGDNFTTKLFMMSKIQNLNGTHNLFWLPMIATLVVYDVKDTKFEWNSQLRFLSLFQRNVVYDVKDTKFEWNSQLGIANCPKHSCCL